MLKGKWLIIALLLAGSLWRESLSSVQPQVGGTEVRLTNNTELSSMSPELMRKK